MRDHGPVAGRRAGASGGPPINGLKVALPRDMENASPRFAALATLVVNFLTGCAVEPGDQTTSKTVFVTPQATSGNLGGLAGGDKWCNDVAMSSGLPGTYVAWLSTSEVNAIDRVIGNGPWFNPRYSDFGAIEVFASHADLAAGNIESAIRAPTAEWSPGEYPATWTGTTNRGQFTGDDCNAWTSAGSADGLPPLVVQGTFGGFSLEILDWSATWSQMAADEPGNPPGPPNDCSNFSRIYCFEN